MTVESINQNGQVITGYYTVLRTHTGTKIASGYTTKTFTSGTTAGTQYEIELDSYGSCTFTNWQGTSNSGDLSFTATSGPQTFVGVYNCTNAGAPAYHTTAQPLPVLAVAFIVGMSLLVGGIEKAKGKDQSD